LRAGALSSQVYGACELAEGWIVGECDGDGVLISVLASDIADTGAVGSGVVGFAAGNGAFDGEIIGIGRGMRDFPFCLASNFKDECATHASSLRLIPEFREAGEHPGFAVVEGSVRVFDFVGFFGEFAFSGAFFDEVFGGLYLFFEVVVFFLHVGGGVFGGVFVAVADEFGF
jgi:hypothetical protein